MVFSEKIFNHSFFKHGSKYIQKNVQRNKLIYNWGQFNLFCNNVDQNIHALFWRPYYVPIASSMDF